MERLRGHRIEERDDRWCYADTGEPTVETHGERPCGCCGVHGAADGHDPCLGTLPGVMNACCGHGQPGEAYVQFEDGFTISGEKAIEHIRRIMDGEIARHDNPNFTVDIEPKWHDEFNERQLRLIKNCQNYVLNDPAGLPGHQLMLIIAKLVGVLGGEMPDESTPVQGTISVRRPI